jgi:hypothetical protein
VQSTPRARLQPVARTKGHEGVCVAPRQTRCANRATVCLVEAIVEDTGLGRVLGGESDIAVRILLDRRSEEAILPGLERVRARLDILLHSMYSAHHLAFYCPVACVP